MQGGIDFFHVVVAGIGVNHHSIVSAAFIEIRLLEHSDLDRRIHQPVVVLGAKPTALGQRGEWRGHVPSLGKLAKTHGHRPVARVHRIHENLSQIEERVMRVELCAEGSGRIDKDLIFHYGATLRAGELPSALVQRAHRERPAGAVFRPYPIHILCKVADLIQRVPYRKLQLPLRRALRQQNLHLHEMLVGICQRNRVFSCRVATRHSDAQKQERRQASGGPGFS